MPVPSVTFRTELDAVTRKELDQMTAETAGYVLLEHDDEGRHTHIHADSITVKKNDGTGTKGDIVADGDLKIAGDGPHTLGGPLETRSWINVRDMAPPSAAPVMDPMPTSEVLVHGYVGTSATGVGGSVGPGVLLRKAPGPGGTSEWSVLVAEDPMLQKPCISVVYQGTNPLGAGLPFLIRANNNGGAVSGFDIVPAYVTEGTKHVNLGSRTLGYFSSYEGFTEVNARRIDARDAFYERTRTVPVGEWQSYPSTWASSDGNFQIGNGSLFGMYSLVGKTCHVSARVATGTTTVYGTGLYLITLPFPISDAIQPHPVGQAYVYNGANGALFTGVALTKAWYFGGSGISQIIIIANNTYVTQGAPFAWNTAGSQIVFSMTYQIA